MKLRIGLALLVCVAFLSGCADAPQIPIKLNASAIAEKSQRIGVGMTALPKVDTYLPGADCLLCMAAASIANSALTAHTQTLPYEELPQLKNEVAALLRKRGAEVMVIPDALDINALTDYGVKGTNVAKKDFSSLRKKYNIDKLLVINIAMLGMVRNYSAYIPTSDPKGVLRGTGYMVNLTNNTYEWYLPVSITKSADGNWDEPPKFPGLTNAYFQALELGKDRFLKPFN